MICKRCKIIMEIGDVIDAPYPYGIVATPLIKNPKIIKCWKCPECGHSEDIDENDK